MDSDGSCALGAIFTLTKELATESTDNGSGFNLFRDWHQSSAGGRIAAVSRDALWEASLWAKVFRR